GLWYSPLKRALDAFIAETQRHVSGDIRLTLHGGRATVTGRRSDASLYDFALATYDEGDTFDQSLAKGFIELWGLPSKLAAARDARVQGRRQFGPRPMPSPPRRRSACGAAGSRPARRRRSPPCRPPCSSTGCSLRTTSPV